MLKYGSAPDQLGTAVAFPDAALEAGMQDHGVATIGEGAAIAEIEIAFCRQTFGENNVMLRQATASSRSRVV